RSSDLAAPQALVEEPQALAEGVRGVAGDRELLVELQQLEVIRGRLGHQAQPHPALRLRGREVLVAGRLVEAPDPAPEVELPARRELAVEAVAGRAGAGGGRVAEDGVAAAVGVAGVPDSGEELAAGLERE